MSEFFKVDNNSSFGIVDNYAIGYENETTFFFTEEEIFQDSEENGRDS